MSAAAKPPGDPTAPATPGAWVGSFDAVYGVSRRAERIRKEEEEKRRKGGRTGAAGPKGYRELMGL